MMNCYYSSLDMLCAGSASPNSDEQGGDSYDTEWERDSLEFGGMWHQLRIKFCE